MNGLLQTLALSLLHALWELALLGLLAWGGLGLLRHRGAAAQYGLACVFLLAMLLAPVCTFVLLDAGGTELVAGVLQAPVLEASGAAAGPRSALAALAPWVAWGWMAGSALMLLRLGSGWFWLQGAYLERSQAAPAAWQAVLDGLARRMGVRGRVRLRVSARAASPLLVGWLRPAVLVPAAAFLQLSPEALEAVLAHELAHVRRSDYLVNLLQGLAEALLFFHPCAWWLSGRIRDLREHCCDDRAAALLGDPLPLAEGLAALERLRRSLPPDPSPALAAAKGKLMHRISRLFTPQETPVPSLRGVVLALAGTSVLCAGALALRPEGRGAVSSPSASGPVDIPFGRVKVLHQPPAPAYPAEAKAQKIQGTVVVELTLDEKGVPVDAKAVEGPEALRATAEAYARAWRFAPVKRDGKPASVRFKLTMPFRLKGEASPSAGGVHQVDFTRVKVRTQPPAPPYPEEAKAKMIQGTVVVELTLDEQGVPVAAKAVEGPEALRATAEAYALAWRFEPVQKKGKVSFRLTMPFKLR